MASDSFSHTFEGPEALEALLELAQCPLSFDGVVEAMKAAQSQGDTAQECIPQLFFDPPRFPSPQVAKKFYQNMLGLWDELASGQNVAAPLPKKPREKKVRPTPPGAFGQDGPSAEYVAEAMRYLERLDKKEQDRLRHKFENRQDALLGFLDEQAISDEAYASIRQILFNVFAVLDTGWPAGVGSVSPLDLKGAVEASSLSSTLSSFAEELEFEDTKRICVQGIWALWNARKTE